MDILNTGVSPKTDTAVESPEELGRCLQKAMLQMKGEHMSGDGRGVDYAALASSKSFSDYVQLAGQLEHCDLTTLPQDERMAFFINIYNCLTIHGLASGNQLPTSVLEVKEFWKRTAYSINGLAFSLDDIEHGVLRGNRPHPSAGTPPFAEGDPRRAVSMEKCDPRIHFTLVCGAKSCPAIQVYSAKNLERALTLAAQNFCSQEVDVLSNEGVVKLSKIFLWYGSDFAADERGLLRYVSQHVKAEVRTDLEEILRNHDDVHIEFKEYDWKLNKI